MGVLSLFSPATTGDQVDSAHSIVVARVEAMQVLDQENQTILNLDIDHYVAGATGRFKKSLVVDGRPPVEVGDNVLAFLDTDPDAVLGVYQIEKDSETLQYQVTNPISGMWTEGISDYPPVSLAKLELAIKVRRGMLNASVLNQPQDDVNTPKIYDDVEDDGAEPNNDFNDAQKVFPSAPHLITGTPLCITGLTLTIDDVDFFKFTGAALAILHVETRPPDGLTFVPPRLTDLDTLVGLFDVNQTLLNYDDDSGLGSFSRFATPLELNSEYFVAVESAPDEGPPDFDHPSGKNTTGAYELKLELEKASYLTNFTELVIGVSVDGSFIEDFIGFKRIGGEDVLTPGVQIDGWGLSYNALTVLGQLYAKMGAGTFAGDPGFIGTPEPDVFVLGPLVDAAGYNRAGFAKAAQFVPYIVVPRRGIKVTNVYRLSLNADTVRSDIELNVVSTNRVNDIKYARILDPDLFGTGADRFYWNFDAGAPVRCFPVDAATNVGAFLDNPPGPDPGGDVGGGQPSQGVGDEFGDFQMAMIIDHGDLLVGFQHTLLFPAAYTLVVDDDEEDAVAAAQANLEAAGATTWCIAVDTDYSSESPGGDYLWLAFGVGLGPQKN
jgi:hypothetical protein